MKLRLEHYSLHLSAMICTLAIGVLSKLAPAQEAPSGREHNPDQVEDLLKRSSLNTIDPLRDQVSFFYYESIDMPDRRKNVEVQIVAYAQSRRISISATDDSAWDDGTNRAKMTRELEVEMTVTDWNKLSRQVWACVEAIKRDPKTGNYSDNSTDLEDSFLIDLDQSDSPSATDASYGRLSFHLNGREGEGIFNRNSPAVRDITKIREYFESIHSQRSFREEKRCELFPSDRAPAVQVSLEELWNNASAYDRKRVSVTGFFGGSLINGGLTSSLSAEPGDDDYFHVNVHGPFLKANLEVSNDRQVGRRVRLEGFFSAANGMEFFPGVLSRITSVSVVDEPNAPDLSTQSP